MRRRDRHDRTDIPDYILSADGEASPLWEQWCDVTGYKLTDFIIEHIRRQLPAPRKVKQ